MRPHLLCKAANSQLSRPLQCVALRAALLWWSCWWLRGWSVTSVRLHYSHHNHSKTTSCFDHLILKVRKRKARYQIDFVMFNWLFTGIESTRQKLKRSVNRVIFAVHLEHSLLNDTNNIVQTGDKPFRWHFSKWSISFISVELWNIWYSTSQNNFLSLCFCSLSLFTSYKLLCL